GGALGDYVWRIGLRGREERAEGGGAGAVAGAGGSAPGDGIAGDGGGSVWNDSSGVGTQRADDREQRFVDCSACEGGGVDAGHEQRAGVPASAGVEGGELGGLGAAGQLKQRGTEILSAQKEWSCQDGPQRAALLQEQGGRPDQVGANASANEGRGKGK